MSVAPSGFKLALMYEQNPIACGQSARPVSDDYDDPGVRQIAQHFDQSGLADRVQWGGWLI
jgi:hypothetical protein